MELAGVFPSCKASHHVNHTLPDLSYIYTYKTIAFKIEKGHACRVVFCLLGSVGGQNTRILDVLERLLSRTHRKEPKFITKPHQTPATCLGAFLALVYHSEFDQSEARFSVGGFRSDRRVLR